MARVGRPSWLERCSAEVVGDRERENVQGVIRQHVERGSELSTDEWSAYFGLAPEYVHKIINHADAYVDGQVHTNGLENFWSLLKRGLKGTYVSVEPYHLFRYLDEQIFRYNNRATKKHFASDSDRFELAVSQVFGKRITYSALIGRELEKPHAEAF